MLRNELELQEGESETSPVCETVVSQQAGALTGRKWKRSETENLFVNPGMWLRDISSAKDKCKMETSRQIKCVWLIVTTRKGVAVGCGSQQRKHSCVVVIRIRGPVSLIMWCFLQCVDLQAVDASSSVTAWRAAGCSLKSEPTTASCILGIKHQHCLQQGLLTNVKITSKLTATLFFHLLS